MFSRSGGKPTKADRMVTRDIEQPLRKWGHPSQEQRGSISDLGYVSRISKNTSRIWCLREPNRKEKSV